MPSSPTLTNVNLSPEAKAVLDEFVLENSVPGNVLRVGATASESIIANLFHQLSPARQRLLVEKYPELAALKKTK